MITHAVHRAQSMHACPAKHLKRRRLLTAHVDGRMFRMPCHPIRGLSRVGMVVTQIRGQNVLHGESNRGLAPLRYTTKQGTPAVNPNARQSAQLAVQAPGAVETAPYE